jgi:hypothetical protein
VDLLAALYVPIPHEKFEFVRPSPIVVDLSTYHADVVDAHKLYLIKQLASYGWVISSGYDRDPAVVGWSERSTRPSFAEMKSRRKRREAGGWRRILTGEDA